MRITRREIIRAIRTEKLIAGAFIQVRFDDVECSWVKDKKCKVCAVGAVLRHKGFHNSSINDLGGLLTTDCGALRDSDEKESIAQCAYMSALSIKFEKLAKRHGCGAKTKELLIKFVKTNFPLQVTLRGLPNE